MNEETTITIELNVAETNVILGLLGEISYNKSANLISKIKGQAAVQLQAMGIAEQAEENTESEESQE